MASLSDTAKAAKEVQELAQRLHAEILNGKGDFARFVALADTISEKGDALAGAFHEADRLLTRLLNGDEPIVQELVSGDGETREEPPGAEDVVAELREITSRLHELEQRLEDVRAEGERPPAESEHESERVSAAAGDAAGASGENGGAISQLTSRQSANGSQAYEHLTREQLYTWAQDADVAGRSRMSKEDLIAALGGPARRAADTG